MRAEDRLAAVAEHAGSGGVFCDFDGCLSPIVPDPDEARPVAGAEAVLARLAARFRVVAIVSGRSVSSLQRRVRVPGVRLYGLHGIEHTDESGRPVVVAEARRHRDAVDRAAARLERELAAAPGVTIEHKGSAIAVHTRRAADAEAAQRAAEPLVLTVAASEGLRAEVGRRIIEIRPPVAVDKGSVVSDVVRSEALDAALVAGDDTGDVAAFRAVAALPTAVRVAVASAEAPQALLQEADIRVEGPAAFVAALERLAALAGA